MYEIKGVLYGEYRSIHKKRNLIVAVMLLSAFIAILNQTLLNTALPHIMKELNTSENTAQWLVTGFMLVNGTMIPLTAYLMDRIKTKPLYLVSMGIFLVGSIVAAIAPSFGVLMFARVIQAIGAGIIMPLMQFTLFTLFSKRNVDLQWDWLVWSYNLLQQ